MNILQQAVINIHVANNIKAFVVSNRDPEYPALFFDKTKTTLGQFPPKNSEDYLALYGKMAPVYRAVNVKAKTIAQLPIKILKKIGEDEFEDVTNTRPEYKIFMQPNEFHTKFEFWEQAIGYLQLVGESPWLLKRDGIGNKITAMYPVRPDLLKIIPHNLTLVDHYLYRIASQQELRIDPEFMLFVKFFNPLDHLRGLSAIAAAENEVVLDINAVNASKQTFKEGGQPSGIISTKEKIGSAEGRRVKEDIVDKYSGTKNFGKIMFLTHGFEWQQMQMNNRDMQYMEQREWNEKTIAQVFGVPPILQMQFKDSSVLQNTEIQYKLFWDNLVSEITKIEEIITIRLLPDITDEQDVFFKFDLSNVAALKPDLTEKTKRYKEAFGMGAVSPNEVRQDILGKDIIKNPAMDEYYVPFNLQPIADAGMDIEEIEDDSKQFFDSITKMERDIIINNNGGGIIGEIKTTIKEIEASTYEVEDKVFIQKTINHLNKINEKSINSFKKILAALFKEQGKEVVSNLHRDKYYKFTVTGVIFNLAKWVKKFQAAGRPEIARALEFAAADLAKDFSETYDVTDPNALKYINKRSIDYAKQVNKTTTKKIDALLKSALEDNLSIDETAAKLTQFFESNSVMRSLRIARTEIIRATNEGRQFAANQIKSVKFKQWTSQRDGLVRDEHVSMDGELVAKDKAFSNGSFVPEDFNERCYVIYRKKK